MIRGLAVAAIALAGCDTAIDHFLPPPSTFPTEANTGYAWTGTALAPYSGGPVLEDGARLEGVEILQCLTVTGDGVSIVKSLIRASCDGTPIVYATGANLLLEDVEIDGGGTATAEAVVGGLGLVARRVHIHDVHQGVMQQGAGITIEDSLIDVDADAFLDESNGQVRLHHSSFESKGGHGAVIIWNHCAEIADVLVDENRVASGGEFVVHGGSGPAEDRPNRDTRFIGNVWALRPAPQIGNVSFYLPEGPESRWMNNIDENGAVVGPR